jgi:hypothetical protein
MPNKSTIEISSFILRFVKDKHIKNGEIFFRGSVRHIQSDREIQFTHWAEVEDFIQNYFPLDQLAETKINNEYQ